MKTQLLKKRNRTRRRRIRADHILVIFFFVVGLFLFFVFFGRRFLDVACLAKGDRSAAPLVCYCPHGNHQRLAPPAGGSRRQNGVVYLTHRFTVAI